LAAATPGGGTDRRATRESPAPPGSGPLALTLFLMALAMFFAASVIGFLLIRARQPEWPPAGSPPLPGGLWLATRVLLAGRAAAPAALAALRRGSQRGLRIGLAAALALAVLFLGVQAANWSALAREGLTPGRNLFGFAFYMLTGLHAAHVIGGLVVLVLVAVKAFRGGYSAGYHPGVRSAAVYTHFLTVVWIVMFGVVFLT
jgi:cytochrome c oxidase subunit 3